MSEEASPVPDSPAPAQSSSESALTPSEPVPTHAPTEVEVNGSTPSDTQLVTPPPIEAPEVVQEGVEPAAMVTPEVEEVAVPDVPGPGSKPIEEAPKPPAESSPTSVQTSTRKKSSRGHMLAVVRARKAEGLEKIVAMTREKGTITNDDVEKLLKVSDATSTRYLNSLVLAGRLWRTGYAGGARYSIPNGSNSAI